jgi:diguanylate cyclase (GGDEF)-like protein
MSMKCHDGEGVTLMDVRDDVARLSAALTEIEDQYLWDAEASLATARTIEEQALALGDERLVFRARLCQANMRMRLGEVAAAARQIWKIHQWATDHADNLLAARTHVVWANIHRHLGDASQSLEHSVLAVELLDENASPHMQVWHRAKLADALGLAGSMDAARTRYAQTEELAIRLGQIRQLVGMLNNYAYIEYAAGSHDRAAAVAERLQAAATAHNIPLDPTDLDTIGSVQIARGQFAEAVATMEQCLAGRTDGLLENADSLAEYLLTMTRALRGLGDTDRAQQTLDRSRAICVERELGDTLVRVHQEQAELHAARGEFADAFAVHKIFYEANNALRSSQREAQARTRQAMFETTEARQEAERFREQARRDPLTGLRNRRFLDEELPELIEAGGPLTVAIIDLDHFKRVNDQLSHDVGDQVLVLVAKLLETQLAAVSPNGFVARMGGEEFLMVLPGIEVSEAAGPLEGVRRAVGSHDWTELTYGLPVTVSIGVAGLGDVPTPSQAGLLSTADRHLYVAKHAGRDRVVFTTPQDGRLRSYRDSASAA